MGRLFLRGLKILQKQCEEEEEKEEEGEEKYEGNGPNLKCISCMSLTRFLSNLLCKVMCM